MHAKKLLVAALAVAAALPGAAAAWGANGQREPDTVWDRTEGRMFLAPDTSPASKGLAGERVYFNGFIVNDAGTNPNVAAQAGPAGGTRLFMYPSATFVALLGVWKDCNRDGYVGAAETALADYRAELLSVPDASGAAPGTATCPVTPRAYNDLPVHNDGAWVKEMIFLGAVDPCRFEPDPYRNERCGGIAQFTRNPDVVYANGTKVWGDSGWPGDPGRGTCPVSPLPRGTTSGTGALLYYADCFDGRLLARTANDADAAAGGGTGLRFDDPGAPQWSESALNQHFPVNLWGNPYTNGTGALQAFDPADSRYAYRPAFSTQDCSRPRTDVRDPTAGPTGNGTLHQVGVKAPAGTPKGAQDDEGYLGASANLTDADGVILGHYGHQAPDGVDPQGSFVAGVEDAYEAVYLGRDHQDRSAGDCDRSTNSTAHVDTALESEFEPEGEKPKSHNGLTFTFSQGSRGAVDEETDGSLGLAYTPTSDLGTSAARIAFDGPIWTGSPGLLNAIQLVDRYTQRPMPSLYYTYYAHLDPAVVAALGLALPPTSSGKYGAEACTAGIGAGQPARNGWSCDPSTWWIDIGGSDGMPYYADQSPGKRVAVGSRVGDDFTLRDVDCYDGYVAGVPSEGVSVHASLVPLASDPRPCRA